DEVTAVALLRLFTDDEIIVHRIEHDTEDFTPYDMVIDISKQFDGVKYFDHHQNKGGKSSAGLIWEYLGIEEKYPKISKLIKLVDDNDVGIQRAKPFEYSNLIKCFNSSKIHSSTQDIQFEKAVDFAMTVIGSMAQYAEGLHESEKIIQQSYMFNNNPSILELSTFTPHWATYVNAKETPHIKAVVWEDKEDENWKVRVPAKRPGSFELHGKALLDDESMKFVHSAGHFAIAKDEKTMCEYLEKQNI
ncbi:MAG: MYG1 family protein, partial [Arcobacteraceae bacterium]